MKQHFLTLILFFTTTFILQSQILDTLVDVGGYKLHFNIIKGKGTPILFEPGSSFRGLPWNGTLDLIHKITGATIITYDRSGFGKSELNPNETDATKFGINNNMKELETALAKLGYVDDFVLAGHSIGTFYSSLFAARHPEKTKGVVLLNGHLPDYWTKERLTKSQAPNKDKLALHKYYVQVNFANTLDILRQEEIPAAIPVIDIVAGIPIFFMSDKDFIDWKYSHKIFVDKNLSRQGILADGSGHYIFKYNEVLFLNAVIKIYAETLTGEQKIEVLSRGIDITMERANYAKKEQMEYLNSELSFRRFANTLLQKGELDNALEVLKLNVMLFPQSWKTYDNYGKVLLKSQRKTEAIEIYEKSIELNPDNEQSKSILEEIKQD